MRKCVGGLSHWRRSTLKTKTIYSYQIFLFCILILCVCRQNIATMHLEAFVNVQIAKDLFINIYALAFFINAAVNCYMRFRGLWPSVSKSWYIHRIWQKNPNAYLPGSHRIKLESRKDPGLYRSGACDVWVCHASPWASDRSRRGNSHCTCPTLVWLMNLRCPESVHWRGEGRRGADLVSQLAMAAHYRVVMDMQSHIWAQSQAEPGHMRVHTHTHTGNSQQDAASISNAEWGMTTDRELHLSIGKEAHRRPSQHESGVPGSVPTASFPMMGICKVDQITLYQRRTFFSNF